MGAEAVEPRLRELARRYRLEEGQREQLARVLAALEADRRAPSAVREADQAVNVHVADSLVALEIEGVGEARRIADLGTGAGFPGVVLAVALPATEVRLVESNARKCVFVEGMLADVGLASRARVVRRRIEEWQEGRGRHDLVVARALARQPVVLEYAAPLLSMGGVLLDWRGKRSDEEEGEAGRAAEELGLRLVEVRAVTPFEGARDRHLHLYLKISETPARFPRRAGVASRRPLGAREHV